ncbi:DUF309 domain-containing protein [Actinophytocola glycyrrhizae]|uniref:DUF309 domain-containing protein n=1 Tax=Actinophytocola glycyrrhizae TaxID=2044873 RepID=A0ABV9SAJ4_9PSEU
MRDGAMDSGDNGRRADRDRDAAGHARNERPRDRLGRPLPRGVPGVPRQPEGVVRTPDETLLEAQRLLDLGMPFHAHEVLEDAWKSAPEASRGLWKGLAQLAVGVTHAARGNVAGAGALLTRGADNIEPYEGAPAYGLDITALLRWARGHAAAIADGAAQVPVLHLRNGPPHPG